jgi:glutamyl-tRNA reductase
VFPIEAFQVVGLSHRQAALQVRELFALAPEDAARLLQREAALRHPTVVLTTCNRCELYCHGEHDAAALFRELGGRHAEAAELPLQHLRGLDAIRHLLRVAGGLESQMIGETEILGQVRRAYDLARAHGATDRGLDTIFSAALAAGRRVRHETPLGRHPLSVTDAAVDLVRGAWGGLGGRRVTLVGAGEAAEGVLRALNGAGATVTLINRQPERAAALASAWGVTDVRELDCLPEAIAEADLLVVATAAAAPTVTVDMLSAAAGRPSGPLWVVDLAVPRNVEPEARDLDHVRLFDLDDLRARRCPVPPSAAASALPDAERILEEELARLVTALRSHVVAPRIAELHREGERLVAQEVDWALRQLDGLSNDEQSVVRQMAERLVRRVLFPVSRAIRE